MNSKSQNVPGCARPSHKGWKLFAGATLIAAVSATTDTSSACGGFFCSQAQPVNQAAERIVFADNGDGTVTAVIEIQYQGPSENFSWLLPISTVPQGDEIAVASKLSFDRLQARTNPLYQLTTRVEGTCDDDSEFASGGDSGFAEGGAPSVGGASAGGDVTVEASGLVGAFEWTVISLDASLPQPADAAVSWLTDNGYDVPPGSAGLLGPYLEEGMYLLALRLQKGATTGSIRPIALTYDAARPMIPIKLTAVAANDDMGVMTWVLGDSRAVPQNYYALELNEARINWFNPNPTYNDVVIAAADEAGGQGFVTEYAQDASDLAEATWSSFDEQMWVVFSANAASYDDPLIEAMYNFSQWDGFWDVVRTEVTLPADVTLEDVQACPECYSGELEYVLADFLAALEQDVIQPARLVQELIDTKSYATRLYSTLSAEEMTVDPLFTFNPDLPDVDNFHTAERVIECSPAYYQSDAPWRIELPQGGVVRGGPGDFGTWPSAFDELPANRRILRMGESGLGQVLEDNSELIDDAIQTYSEGVPDPPRHLPDSIPGESIDGGVGPAAPGSPSPASNDSPGSSDIPLAPTGGCACRNSHGGSTAALSFGLLALLVFAMRLRARASSTAASQ